MAASGIGGRDGEGNGGGNGGGDGRGGAGRGPHGARGWWGFLGSGEFEPWAAEVDRWALEPLERKATEAP